jgi:hypothetical protein
LRTVLELLVLEPRLAAIINPGDLAEGAGVHGVDQAELQTLDTVLEAVGSGDTPINLGEVFRGSPHETVVFNAEVGALRWQDRSLTEVELEAEFRGAWQQAIDRIRRARIAALLDKSRRQELSSEDQAQYRLLQQAVSVTSSK